MVPFSWRPSFLIVAQGAKLVNFRRLAPPQINSTSRDPAGSTFPVPMRPLAKLSYSFTRGGLLAHPRSRESCPHIRPCIIPVASTFPVRARFISIFSIMHFHSKFV